MLEFAYRADLVPAHLHGKTQHKTLHARLSEEIVERRENSPFFRSAPGVFFLREFITDSSLPEKYRVEIPTRRRIREILRGPALALEEEKLSKISCKNQYIEPDKIRNLFDKDQFYYDDPKQRKENSVFIWSFVSVVKDAKILSYRLGRYREHRDSFVHKRTIGFTTLVHRDDRNLFNIENFGIVESGVKATVVDLDIPIATIDTLGGGSNAALKCFLWIPNAKSSSDLIAVVQFHCPEWFEPLQRRLAMNDLQWLDLVNPTNDIDDFDPWSNTKPR